MESISPISPVRKNAVNTSTSVRICPNGCGHLALLTVSDIAVERCYICGGVYLESQSAAKLRNLPAEDGRALERDIASRIHPANAQKAAEARHRTDLRPCPNCRSLMLPYVVQYRVPITLDHCGVCDGYWADDSELEAVSVPVDARHDVALDVRVSTEFRNEVIEALYENEGGAPRQKPSEDALGHLFPTFASWIRDHHATGGRSRGV